MLFDLFFAYRRAKKSLEACQQVRMLDPMMQAYRQGNYEQAMALATDSFMQAEILIQLGRASEAEEILRRMAETEKEAKPRTLVMSQLGHVLMRRQQYDEAMECFQLALRMWPERGSTYRAIAEWHLRRGDNSAEALRWARLAVEKEKAGPGLSPDSKELCLMEDFSTLAWAVAVHSHDGAEVDRLCEQIAFPAITPYCSLAMSSFQFGKAWAAVGNITDSAAQFEAAIQRDPKGLWAREAAAHRVMNPA
jgi:tetratricopeptide (TPR) repeat protein